MSSTFALSLLSENILHVNQSSPFQSFGKGSSFAQSFQVNGKQQTIELFYLVEEKKKLVDLTFPVATLILKGTNITERRYNYNHKTKGKIVRLTSILFSSSEI